MAITSIPLRTDNLPTDRGFRGWNLELYYYLAQTLTLAFIVTLLACNIHNFYKGAAKMRMFWMHLFNFFLFIAYVTASIGQIYYGWD